MTHTEEWDAIRALLSQATTEPNLYRQNEYVIRAISRLLAIVQAQHES